jgi:excisionase family DNA binding protein/PAS domain S-box-containing protein
MTAKNRKSTIPGHIMIMDSDRSAVSELMECLCKEGYRVAIAEQTNRCFEKLMNEQFDVLILAVETWGIKGYELIPIIKRLNNFIPIIVTSADDSMDVATKVREQGVFYYAIKPLDMNEIKLVVRNALNRRFTRKYGSSVSKQNNIQGDFEDEILDLAGASKILKMGKKTVSKLARNGEIPGSRVGKKWRFIRNQLLEWLRITAAGNQRNYGTLILETMDEGVAVVDRKLRIVSCNSAYLQALDLPRDRIIGEYCYRVSHRSEMPCEENSCPVRQAFRTKNPVKLMHVNYDNEGKEHYCDIIALPMRNKEGRVNQVLEVIRDNTEIYNLNKHLNWIMSFFAHETKKTLGPVVMNISALMDGNLSATISDERRKEMLLSSLCSLKLLHDMIRNYIVSYKGESGTIKCQKKSVNINKSIIEPVIYELKPLFYKKNMEIETQIKGGRPVYCDADLMKIAFSNIVNNAAKYGTDGTKIQCFITINDMGFQLRILNEGMGIPRNNLNDIFDRFARFDELGISGSGLGLHVVKMIVEMHNGTLKAESGYLIDKEFITYDEFYAHPSKYKSDKKNLKKFARFILKIPAGEEI